MEVGLEDSSEDEFERQELEAALYSQTHFATGPSNGVDLSPFTSSSVFRNSSLTHRLRVGVKELATRIMPKQPVGLGSFISFSRRNEDSVGFEKNNAKTESPHTPNQDGGKYQSENQSSFEPVISAQNTVDTVESQDDDNLLLMHVLEVENNIYNQEHGTIEKQGFSSKSNQQSLQAPSRFHKAGSIEQVNKTEIIELEPVSANEPEPIIGKEQSKNCSLPQNSSLKQSSKTSTSKKNEPDNTGLLPFKITKASEVKKKPAVVLVEDKEDERVIEIKESPAKKKVTKKTPSQQLPKLQDFLEIPKSSKASSTNKSQFMRLPKGKCLTKGEAAVKPRKPVVQIRRIRPPAVLVRYRQDSDTNTDYSDSDAASTPRKKKKGKSNRDQKESELSYDDQLCGAVKDTPEHKDDNTVSPSDEDRGSLHVKKNVERETAPVNSERSADVSPSDGSSDEDRDSNDKYEVDSIHIDEEDFKNDNDKEEMNLDDSDDDISDNIDDSDDDDEDSEEEETDDTESSEGEQLDSMTGLSGLDFNLAGGVSKLLSNTQADVPTSSKESNDLWKIEDRDKYSVKGPLSRYFAPQAIHCRNCKKEGHLSRDCPEPLKQRCIYCGEEGHQFKACPQSICYNCLAPGHRTSDCTQPKMNWHTPCERCWMKGHTTQMCPDNWRQLHLSLNPAQPVLGRNSKGQAVIKEKNPLVFCYNCGRKGHWGHDCRMQRMNRFASASYPFVAKFDKVSTIKEYSCPEGMTYEEAHVDFLMEEKLKNYHEMMRIKETASLRSKASDLMDELEKQRSDIAKRLQGSDGKQKTIHKDVERKRKDKKSNRSQERKRDNEHKAVCKTMAPKNVQSTSSTPKQELSKHPAFQSASTSKSVKSSKGRKRERRQYLDENDSDDSLADMAAHQVSKNEWWLTDQSPAKKVRGKKKEKESFAFFDEDQINEDDFMDDEPVQIEPSPELVGHPQTTFVYVDRLHPPATPYRNDVHFTGHNYQDFISHKNNTLQSHQGITFDKSFRKNLHSGEHHNSHDSDHGLKKSPKRHSSHSSIARYREEQQALQREKTNSSSRPHHHHDFDNKRRRSHEVSANRSSDFNSERKKAKPSLPKSKKRKPEPIPNKGGFKARHERFVAMKHDCDIRISLRK